MKIKTAELIGQALEWAVAMSEGHKPPLLRVLRGNVALPQEDDPMWCDYMDYSTNWAQGGPIIEREEIDIDLYTSRKVSCVAALWISRKGQNPPSVGRTPLVAAMRCYVASKLGDEVEIPEELTKST